MKLPSVESDKVTPEGLYVPKLIFCSYYSVMVLRIFLKVPSLLSSDMQDKNVDLTALTKIIHLYNMNPSKVM
jgi:hypothetical protein